MTNHPNDLPPVGSRWRHYKGGLYVVVGHYCDERSCVTGVLYREVDKPDSMPWGRLIATWYWCDGPVNKRRFTRVEDEADAGQVAREEGQRDGG